MAVKELNARVRSKRDTNANWEAHDPVLLDGETVIVDTTDGSVRRKTGDGTKTYTQLPFDDEAIYQAIKGISAGGGGTAYTLTLTAAGWSNGQQSVSIEGLTAERNGVVGLTQDVTSEQLSAASDAALYPCGQSDGTLTIAVSGDTPTVDIPIVVILL